LNGLHRDKMWVGERHRVNVLSFQILINHVSEQRTTIGYTMHLALLKQNLCFIIKTYSVKHLRMLASSSQKWNMSNKTSNCTVEIRASFLKCSSMKCTMRLTTLCGKVLLDTSI